MHEDTHFTALIFGVATYAVPPVFAAPPLPPSAGPAVQRPAEVATTATAQKPCRADRCDSSLFRRPTGLADGLALKELALPLAQEGIRPMLQNDN
jgi:hypothetical protein